MPKADVNILSTDADFLAAARELAELRAKKSGSDRTDRMWSVFDQIVSSPPVSLVSAAVKLRLLCDPDIGLDAAGNADEVEAVRQVLGLVQRVVGVENAFLTVFRQWIEAHLVAAQIGEATGDSPEFDAAMDRVNDLARGIAKIRALGPVGLAVKAYLSAHYEHGPNLVDHPAGVAKLDPALHGALNTDNLVSLVRDAARFVPEIATLAEPLIGEARP